MKPLIKALSNFTFILLFLLVGCTKEEIIPDAVPDTVVEPKPTIGVITVSYTDASEDYLSNFKVIFEKDGIKTIGNNRFTLPFGSYKIYSYSIPSVMTWENRDSCFGNASHPVSTWITDTAYVNLTDVNAYQTIALRRIKTALEVNRIESSSSGYVAYVEIYNSYKLWPYRTERTSTTITGTNIILYTYHTYLKAWIPIK